MGDIFKDAVMRVLKPVERPVYNLEAPPDHRTEAFCTCPECGCTLAEAWNLSDAQAATCPNCEIEFTPILEGFKAQIVSIVERRRRMRRAPGPRAADQDTKDEIFRLMRR